MLVGLCIAPFLALQAFPSLYFQLGPILNGQLHTALEAASIIVSMMIFSVSWHALAWNRDSEMAIACSVFGSVAVADLAHVLLFESSMWAAGPGATAVIIPFFAGRLLAGLALLVLALQLPFSHVPPSWRHVLTLIALLSGWGAAVLGVYASESQIFFAPGAGLTPLKVRLEGGLIVLNLVTAALFMRQHARTRSRNSSLLATGLVVMALSEFAFMLFGQMSDVYFVYGHVLKVVAYIVLYRTLFVRMLSKPVTELTEARRVLAETSERWQMLFQHSLDAVFIGTPEGAVFAANPAACKMFGASEQELIQGGRGLIAVGDDPRLGVLLQQRERDGYARGEVLLKRTDGTRLDAELTSSVYRDSKNRPLTSIVIRDVTARRAIEAQVLQLNETLTRTNQELKQQQQELRVLFDLMPAAILFKDTEGRILRINRYGAKTAGRSVQEIEGMLAQEVFPDIAATCKLADQEVIRTGKPQLGTVDKRLDRHGNDIWVQRDRVPYRDIDGNVIGIVVMMQDITERKRDQDALRQLNASLEERVRSRTAELSLARTEAEQASRAKSDFLAAMSHEIRTPMNAVLGLIELLGLTALNDDQKATQSLAHESGVALLHIIDDILDLSKIEANRLELVPVAASVREVVEKACGLHAQSASRKNLALQGRVAPPISPLLSFDPIRLGQILNNFLSNAIKFTESGSVQLCVDLVERRGDHEQLHFQVRDTGIGMTPEQLGCIFQPFTQASAQTGASYGGTGLGLVISRRLAAMMGGTVEIQSDKGVGTTLTLSLTLPVCNADQQDQSSAPIDRRALLAGRRPTPTVAQAQAEGTLVLVVDDHPTNRHLLLRQLASLGYAGEAAADGVEALAAWQSGRFAALITDCSMPRMNGYELATQIRENEQRSGLPRAPIIACTANALQLARDTCMAAGMDDCLVKPVALTKISEMLDRWVPLGRVGPPDTQHAALSAANSRTTVAMREGLVDMALLADISGGDLTTQTQILADFRRVNEIDATALRHAAGSGQLAQVVQLAHRIKGASMMVGATLLSDACARLEMAAKGDGNPQDVLVAMDSFEAEVLRLNLFLDSMSEASAALGPQVRIEQTAVVGGEGTHRARSVANPDQ
ncbi:MAG: hypothetical protein NVS2B4_00830 [Ramlibacter sp.]